MTVIKTINANGVVNNENRYDFNDHGKKRKDKVII